MVVTRRLSRVVNHSIFVTTRVMEDPIFFGWNESPYECNLKGCISYQLADNTRIQLIESGHVSVCSCKCGKRRCSPRLTTTKAA